MAIRLIKDRRGEAIGRREEGHVNIETDCNCAARGPVIYGAIGSWKKQGRILRSEGIFKGLWREHGPADILILEFWPPEMLQNKFLLF